MYTLLCATMCTGRCMVCTAMCMEDKDKTTTTPKLRRKRGIMTKKEPEDRKSPKKAMDRENKTRGTDR